MTVAQHREHLPFGDLHIELLKCPRGGLTYGILANFPDRPTNVFTGHIEPGMHLQLRKIARHMHRLEIER